MTGIVLVCTHDAVKVAETLARLLAAEDHPVRLCYGRQSLDEIEPVRASKDAVLLIWSVDAPSTHYMLQWLASFDPVRVIEIARAPGWPKNDARKGPVIDFSAWRLGDRGGRAWHQLLERVSVVERALAPARPPPRRAAIALGMASMAAVGGAIFVRVNEAPDAPQLTSHAGTMSLEAAPMDGVGGPVTAFEPASADDTVLRLGVRPHAQPLGAADYEPLAEVPEIPEQDIREPSLLGRISELTGLGQQRPQRE
ncbi:hypothetical protein [Terricaulis sp.]|uniref:hypothetical protein n=1 Tax=Terricaulis sp. TaxID=2768686 RepID=UPI00378397F0